ncbi:ankyrin repeat domain-containing protein [Methylobacillus sp. Pita2]|uniref:ankyrin repeat domain-containing protein n=1 Tax=Methylobacillus sp. Pita2 TaxID=3383245 RepID=UPI0038B44C14
MDQSQIPANDELFAAVNAGDVARVKLALKQVASPDCTNENGATPLMVANQLHHHEIICTLIAAGASISARDLDGHDIDDYFRGKAGTSVKVLSAEEVIAILAASLNKDITDQVEGEQSGKKRI